MGNCLSRDGQSNSDFKVDPTRFSFSRRLDPWDKTGMVAFRNSNLKEFPKQVEVVAKKVRVLDATGNKITDVPDYIQHMTTCNRLGLSKNRIAEIPKSLAALTNLRVLLLDHNRIRSLPRGVYELPKLERLNLSNNYFVEIPRHIGKLKALKYLDVSNNKLVALPKELGQLENLEELHCSNNALNRLPVDLAKLERLRLIVAENNMIDAIPSEIMLYCENLQTIALHGNPITIEKLEGTKGYDAFESRRQAKWDKSLAAGVLLGNTRFSESADRRGQALVTPNASPNSNGNKLELPGSGLTPGGSQENLLGDVKGRRSDEKKNKRKKKSVAMTTSAV